MRHSLVSKARFFHFENVTKREAKIDDRSFFFETNGTEIYVGASKRIFDKWLLFGEKKYIETYVINKNNTRESNMDCIIKHINYQCSLPLVSQIMRKSTMKWKELIAFSLWYYCCYYAYMKYHDVIWKYAKAYPKLTSVIVLLVVIKKLSITCAFVYVLFFRPHSFKFVVKRAVNL